MALITWPMLAQVAQRFAPEECRPCEEWFGAESYGLGLDATQALRLAAALDAQFANEELQDYIAENYQTDARWLSIGDMRDFVVFLLTCGGFWIT
jgi:hypothetical protein